MTDIRVPIFAVGAEKDHVAPWRSTFKMQHLTDTDVTYLLTTGGHNAGIIPDTGRKDSGYRIMRKNHDDYYADADEWLARAQRKNGLWWPEWTNWLASHSGGPVAPPTMGEALCDAPGTYVFQG